MSAFTFRWQRDADAYTNGSHPGTGYTHLWECVCLHDGIPQASRGGIDFGESWGPYDWPTTRAVIEAELAAEARAWMALDRELMLEAA